MDQSDLKPYRCDHLFLLIGTNPAPNYVGARLLLNPGGQLYFVCSRKTGEVAERLSRYWCIEGGKIPHLISVEESDGQAVQHAITEQLRRLSGCTVGLNYTGGTKIMSVHAYQAFYTASAEMQPKPVLSYLDARTGRLVIDQPGSATVRTPPQLFTLQPPPTLETFVGLHALPLKHSIVREPKLVSLAQALADVFAQPEAGEAWRTWYTKDVRPQVRNERGNKYLPESKLRTIVLSAPEDSVLAPLRHKIESVSGTNSDTWSLASLALKANLSPEEPIGAFCEWLDGKWLEHYVLAQVQDLQENMPACRLHSAGMSIEPQRENSGKQFEVDVAVMQGHRLIAISCTTDRTMSLCKSKLIEAWERSRNLGGDEAFVGLVCCYEKPGDLEQSIGHSWDAEGKIRVFGRSDLADLRRHLAEWFIGAIPK